MQAEEYTFSFTDGKRVHSLMNRLFTCVGFMVLMIFLVEAVRSSDHAAILKNHQNQ